MTEVSVVLTTFNRCKLLKRSVKSVLNQSFEDWELIIVDDCSTDRTRLVVKDLIKKNPQHLSRIKYIRLPENHGSDSYPKNFGIKSATGKYVAFLDDDDVYKKDALKVLYNYLSQSGADFVYGDYIWHSQEKNRVSKKINKVGWSIDFDPQMLQRMNYIAMPVVMTRKECLIEVGGFDETVPKFKDWNLWIRLAKRGYKFLHIAIPVTDVYVQEQSVSSKYEVKVDDQGNYLPTYFDPIDCPIYSTKSCLGKEKSLKVAIFTLTMNRLYYTKTCFDKLKQTAGYDYDHFVIDNGSSDGTVKWLQTHEDAFYEVLYEKENIGIAKAWNKAIEKTKDYDIIIKVDNDAYFLTENWLKEFIEIFRRNRQFILSPNVEGLDSVPGGVLRQGGPNANYTMINDRVLGLVPNLGGIVFACSKKLYKDWKFEEDMKGNKDFILSQFAKQIGYQLAYFEEAKVEHYEGTKGQHKRYPKHFEKMSYEKG